MRKTLIIAALLYLGANFSVLATATTEQEGGKSQLHEESKCLKRTGRQLRQKMAMRKIMGKTLVATSDGGVIVMIGNKLFKYDAELNLIGETKIKFDPRENKNLKIPRDKLLKRQKYMEESDTE